jgi:hypothetical protein
VIYAHLRDRGSTQFTKALDDRRFHRRSIRGRRTYVAEPASRITYQWVGTSLSLRSNDSGAHVPHPLPPLAQGDRHVPFDLVIDIENRPGALAEVAKAISDAGVNIAAATCIGPGDRAELHILVPHAEAARHALAISNLAVSREREVVVVEVKDQPGVLADLTRRIARAGIDLDLVYVATRNRIVFGAPDLAGLRAALN